MAVNRRSKINTKYFDEIVPIEKKIKRIESVKKYKKNILDCYEKELRDYQNKIKYLKMEIQELDEDIEYIKKSEEERPELKR